MQVRMDLPSLHIRDGLFISWGRQPRGGETENIFTQVEKLAVSGQEVHVAVVIGGCDENWFRSDTFGGHTLVGGCDPFSNTSTADGERHDWQPMRSIDQGIAVAS